MMPATEERQVRERSRAAVGPVAKMVSLGEAPVAPREPAGLESMVKRAPQGGGNRPGAGPDLQQAALLIMAHHHPAGIARQTLGGFRGNGCAAFQDGLA